jgi:Alginate export
MLVLTLMVSGPVFGQISTSGSADPHVYKTIPAEEDWSFLTDPALRSDFWDPIKYISLRNGAKDWYVSIGGQIREEWERVVNDNWGLQPYDNRYLLERYMLYLDAHYGQHIRTFVHFKSGICTGRIGGPRPIDEKRLDLASAFLEIRTGPGQDSDLVRVGRQELRYGSGRLIDVREGPNVRLSFAGAVGKERLRAWRVNEIAVRPMAEHDSAQAAVEP